MRIERDIKTSHEIDVVLNIFSDPNFTIPLIFPGVKSIKTGEDGKTFEVEGKILTFSYNAKGRVYRGVNEVRYVYESDKGNGVVYIRKKDEKTITVILEHDSNIAAFIGKNYVSSNLNKLAQNIDEIIRLERIKRKI